MWFACEQVLCPHPPYFTSVAPLQVEYRRALVSSFLFKFFVHVANMLESDSQVHMLTMCACFELACPHGIRL